MGEAGGFAQHPGVLQGLPDTEALVRVQDDQFTDLQRDQFQVLQQVQVKYNVIWDNPH